MAKDKNTSRKVPDSFYDEIKSTRKANWITKERLITLRTWAMQGCDTNEIANRIGISPRTFERWMSTTPKIKEAVSMGAEVADAMVENALFDKAIDGHPGSMQYWLKNRRPDEWGGKTRADDANVESIELDNQIKRLKIEEMQRQSYQNEVGIYHGISADNIAPAFIGLHHDIREHNHLEYVLPGGRGSTKSSVISLEIINLIERNPNFHAVICRKVGDTMRNSVYNQMKWAIDKLGLTPEYKCTTTPLEIIKKSTEQHIYFRGADDPMKIKSIAVPFGHIGILWFEELDQFEGQESIRKIEQSVIRGDDNKYIFKSFNPPRSKLNWANKEIMYEKPNRLVVNSTYLDVPKDWLGKPFIDEAEFLKDVNPDAYANEYMGVANGHGGNVFENVVLRDISDEEIQTYDNVVNGVDWGWYPDPFAFVRCQFNKAQQELIIFDEVVSNKVSNEDNAQKLKEHGITDKDFVICDSAEPKSVADFINCGIKARGAIKGNGSIEYGIKWLASLRRIVIDKDRTPIAFQEFTNYEYERDDDGEVISGYPDENNHTIDATRYACEQLSRRMNKITVG